MLFSTRSEIRSASPSGGASLQDSGQAQGATRQSADSGDGGALPLGWTRHESNGREYFFHAASNTTQWEKPCVADDKGKQQDALPDGWVVHLDNAVLISAGNCNAVF